MPSVHDGLIAHLPRRMRDNVGAASSVTSTQALPDTPVAVAAQALVGLNNCDLTASCDKVKTFQNAWNAAQDATGVPASKLTVDGYYGPNTQAAAAQILGPQAPPACAHTDYKGVCSGAAAAPGAITPASGAPLQAGFFGKSTLLWWLIGAVAVAVLGILGYRYEAHGHH
jgi:hypothetical protein